MSVQETLRKLPDFAELTEEELDALAAALDVRDYPDGHLFIREHARGDTIFVILDGTIQVSRDQAELNRLSPGDLFGLIALVDDSPRSATCRALGPCRVGAWPRSVVNLLFNQRAHIALAFQLALANQLARDFRQLDARVRARLA